MVSRYMRKATRQSAIGSIVSGMTINLFRSYNSKVYKNIYQFLALSFTGTQQNYCIIHVFNKLRELRRVGYHLQLAAELIRTT